MATQKSTLKVTVVCPKSLVTLAWSKLTESTGWDATKSQELKSEFFRITAERASKKQPGAKFPDNFVFTFPPSTAKVLAENNIKIVFVLLYLY